MIDNLYNGSRLTAHGEESALKFSVIVPVYNCEKYLSQCLESLCNQENFTHNYEIIIVDDGSTDKSGEICGSYASKYDFIRVTHTENHGVSHARNLALSQAQGDYILFCDGDDFASPQLISIMTRAVELDNNKSDMFVYKYFWGDLPSKGWENYNIADMKNSDWEISNSENLCANILNDGKTGGYLWNKAFKRELIQSHYFHDDIIVIQDLCWVLEILCDNKNISISIIDYCLYCYVQHKGVGLTRDFKKAYSKSGLANFLSDLEKCLKRINNLFPSIREQMQYNLYAYSIHALYRSPVKMKPGTYRKLKLYIKRYCCKYYFRSKAPFISKLKTFVKHVLFLLHNK